MLYQLFITQWLYPCEGDWTVQAKRDLRDLGLDSSIEWMETISKWSFKRLVKRKVREITLKQLIKKKDSYKKLDKLNYTEMKTQSYLLSRMLTFEEKKMIFKFRLWRKLQRWKRIHDMSTLSSTL